jgi:hypothetical protein
VFLLTACDKTETREEPAAESKTSARPGKRERTPDDGRSNSRSGPREALEAAGKLPPGEEREAAIAEVAWNVIEDDPELAAEALAQLTEDGIPRIRLIQHIAMRTAERNPDEAVAWAGTLGSENETSAAFGRIALVIAEDDPERAAKMLSETGVEGRDFNVALVQVLQRWASKDAAAAAEWAALFPAGNFREASITAVVSQWTDANPTSAFTWIASLQEPTIRSEALRAMAESLHEKPGQERKSTLDQADATIRGDLEKELERIDRESEQSTDEELPE